MFKLDDNLLRELGLGSLPPQEKNRILTHIYETLEMRVGIRLAEKMTNEQLDEFESYLPNEQKGTAGDESGALKWLETNFPNYKQVVAEELHKLKEEIKRDAPQIVAALQQQGVAPVHPAAPSATVAAPQPPMTPSMPQEPYQPYQPTQQAQAPYSPQAQPQPESQQPYQAPADPADQYAPPSNDQA